VICLWSVKATVFDFRYNVLVIFAVFIRFYCSYGYNDGYDGGVIQHACCSCTVFTAVFKTFALKPRASLCAPSPVLLWARPPGGSPYRPSSQFLIATLFAALLIVSGDVELNPGPSMVHLLNFAVVNTQSAVQKAAVIHNMIDELQCLALTETWIKLSHPNTIKHDLAPPGFTVLRAHRQTIDKVEVLL
jgi:hypothetical protein